MAKMWIRKRKSYNDADALKGNSAVSCGILVVVLEPHNADFSLNILYMASSMTPMQNCKKNPLKFIFELLTKCHLEKLNISRSK